jgi:hypothetical protein
MNQSDWPKNSENSKSDRKGKERMSVGSSANNSKQQPQLLLHVPCLSKIEVNDLCYVPYGSMRDYNDLSYKSQ